MSENWKTFIRQWSNAELRSIGIPHRTAADWRSGAGEPPRNYIREALRTWISLSLPVKPKPAKKAARKAAKKAARKRK